MKNILQFVSVFLIAGIAGCRNNCRDVACPSLQPPFFAVRLINNAGKDLVTGAFKQYDSSQIRISARRTNSSSVDNIDRFFNFSGDTVAYTGFIVSKDYSVYLLRLNGSITDSFFFNYNQNATACCDLSNFNFTRVNNTNVTAIKLPASYIYQK